LLFQTGPLVPLLLGELDEVTDRKASEKFVNAAGSADKKFISLPGTYHLVGGRGGGGGGFLSS
jgi:hypothetical protein